jgi:hypothetical protein
MAAESRFACFIFERNDKVSQQAVRNAVRAAHERLGRENNRRPRECFVQFAEKPDPGLSAPDFLLAVLRRYLLLEPETAGRPPARNGQMFERIRDKYRLILDVDSGTEYSRRREIMPWR